MLVVTCLISGMLWDVRTDLSVLALLGKGSIAVARELALELHNLTVWFPPVSTRRQFPCLSVRSRRPIDDGSPSLIVLLTLWKDGVNFRLVTRPCTVLSIRRRSLARVLLCRCAVPPEAGVGASMLIFPTPA